MLRNYDARHRSALQAVGKCWLVGCGPGTADHLTVRQLPRCPILLVALFIRKTIYHEIVEVAM